MSTIRFIVLVFSATLIVVRPGGVSSQPYPNKPIHIVTAAAASSADIACRLIAQGISGPLGQQIVVDNRNGVIPPETVAKAAPDGYTLLFAGGTFTVGPLLSKMSFDPVRDFAPITLAVRFPNILVVHPSLPVKSVKELIALAKARPGELNYASSGSGTSSHLAAELFKHMAGVSMVHIPYNAGSSLIAALLSGDIQVLFGSSGTVASHVKSGKLRALAVTSTDPSTLTPGLPTVAASGLPGYESGLLLGMFAPAKTPEEIIRRLNQEMVRTIKLPNTREKLLSLGAEAVGSSPEEYAAIVKSEIARLGKLIKDIGIRAD